jgi:mannose-1-phosphate guanylyltransferase / mannose-6-phosphate isomerase
MDLITPILLAGGSGTRLWPLSRKSYPKQFSQIIDKSSLFQQSALRLTSSQKVKFNRHITLTSSEYRFIVVDQLMSVGIDSGPVLIEPIPKNTAPAILSACLYAYKQDEEAILLVAPSDHVIQDTDAFHDAISLGLKEIKRGKIITFGIKPTYPETGYGYLELEKSNSNNVINLERFIEKPNKVKATEMLAKGNYLWNAGIFLFQARDMISAFNKHNIELLLSTQEALDNAKSDLGFLRLDPKAWSSCKNISVDYAIMEKLDNLAVVPISTGWSDLGGWNTVWKEMLPNEDGVSLSSNAHVLDCKNSLLRSENENQIIVGLGLKDIVAIAMPDAVLVANKNMTQKIKNVVQSLKINDISQAEVFLKDHRPWGWFEILTISKNFQVKRICVKANAAISLQSHNLRSEHWVVVEGTAKVTIEENLQFVTKGQSVYIPIGAVHRLENSSKEPVILIEIQIGSYFGEDDIIRYEDMYSRK